MTNVSAINIAADFAGSSPGVVAPNAAPVSSAPVEPMAEYRLVIEEDSSGSFIYKTLDRRTGEVVNQFPREQMLRLKDAGDYEPGKVFKSQS